MVGVPRLARCDVRAVVADRLALALADAQPADELGADQQAEQQRGRGRRAGAEGDVAEEVEDAREAKLFCDPEKHQSVPARQRLDERGEPDRVRSLDEHRVARADRRAGERQGGRRVGHMRHFHLAAKRFRERFHLVADQDRIIDPGRLQPARRARAWKSSLSGPSSRIAPSTAMRRPATFSSPSTFRVAAIEAGLAL